MEEYPEFFVEESLTEFPGEIFGEILYEIPR